MSFFNFGKQQTSSDRKRCGYKCPGCGHTSSRTFPKGERKTRGWCPVCRQFLTPSSVTIIKTEEKSVRVTKPKSIW